MTYWVAGRGTEWADYLRNVILGVSALYIPAMFGLQFLMKNRKPINLKDVTLIWNVSLTLISLFGFFIMYWCDPTWLTKMFLPEEQYTAGVRAVIAIFTLTKAVEYGDTVLIVLRKRPLTFLHMYHHLSVTIYCWHAQYHNVGFAHGFVAMNLIVHGIMYAYFACCTLSRESRLLKAFRPFITALQLAQMFIGIIISTSALYSSEMTNTPGRYFNAELSVMMYVSYAFLFAEFYVQNYRPNMRRYTAVFLIFFHVFAVVGAVLIWTSKQRVRLLIETVGLYILTGFGITCGAHRLWSHRSYKASFPFRLVLMILNSIACQGTLFHWSRDHRVHHKYSDTGADPHNASRGFWYSHCGWLLLKKPKEVCDAGKEIDCSDLLEDPLVTLQENLDPVWNLSFCFILPSLYGLYMYDSFWLGFFTVGCLRWCLCLNATWCVNSVSHLHGPRPYDPSILPSESRFTALVANGEGWHNWHHVYAYDYATSEFGVLQQYNPSKFIIDVAHKFGMVWDRKRATDVWEKERKRRHEKASLSLQKTQETVPHDCAIASETSAIARRTAAAAMKAEDLTKESTKTSDKLFSSNPWDVVKNVL